MLDYTLRQHPETVRLYESGLSLSRTAAVLGISTVAVWKRLHASGVALRSSGFRKPVAEMALALVPGATTAEAAEKVGLGFSVVLGRIYYRKFSKRDWQDIQPFSADEKALIREAFDADGLDFPDVIELINDHRSMEA